MKYVITMGSFMGNNCEEIVRFIGVIHFVLLRKSAGGSIPLVFRDPFTTPYDPARTTTKVWGSRPPTPRIDANDAYCIFPNFSKFINVILIFVHFRFL